MACNGKCPEHCGKVHKAEPFSRKEKKKIAGASASGAAIGAGGGAYMRSHKATHKWGKFDSQTGIPTKRVRLLPKSKGAAVGAAVAGAAGAGEGAFWAGRNRKGKSAPNYYKDKKISKALMPMTPMKNNKAGPMPAVGKPMQTGGGNMPSPAKMMPKAGMAGQMMAKKPPPKLMNAVNKSFSVNRKEAKKDALQVGLGAAGVGAALGAATKEPHYKPKNGVLKPINKFKAPGKKAALFGALGAASGAAANLKYKKEKK